MNKYPVVEFYNVVRLNPHWSTLVCFTVLCKGRPNLTRSTINTYFKKLVDPEDYCKKDYRRIIDTIMEYIEKQKEEASEKDK